jgi:hypothetical protein
MNLQPAAAAVTVLIALIILVRQLPWFRKSSQAGCGSCGGCSRQVSSASEQIPLVQLGSGLSDRNPLKS